MISTFAQSLAHLLLFVGNNQQMSSLQGLAGEIITEFNTAGRTHTNLTGNNFHIEVAARIHCHRRGGGQEFPAILYNNGRTLGGTVTGIEQTVTLNGISRYYFIFRYSLGVFPILFLNNLLK